MKKNVSVLLKKRKKHPVTTSELLKFFIVFFICSVFVCSVMAFASNGDSWKEMLFHNGQYTDMFMDFFNSLRDAGAEDVYTTRNNIYPPLCLLIFKILGYLIPDALIDTPNSQRTSLKLDESCMMVYFIFACICILSMSTLINTYVNKLNWQNNKRKMAHQNIIAFLLIISYPVMYCLERGNIIILSMLFTMCFVFFKDSDNKVLREFSYISLAIAAGIKLYPAIFGLLLLLEKKFKESIRLVIYGIIAVVVPFVFFIDFDTQSLSIPILTAAINSNRTLVAALGSSDSPLVNILQNLMNFTTKYKSSLNFSSVSIENFIYLFDRNNSSLAKAACAVTEVMALASLLVAKKKWHKVFLITYLMLNIPSASSSYALTFVIIPFIMFLFDDEGNGYTSEKRPLIDRIYILCYTLLLTPLPIIYYFHQEAAVTFFSYFGLSYHSKFNQLIAGFVFQYLFLLIFAEILSMFVISMIKKKKAKVSIADTKVTDDIITETATDTETQTAE